MIFFCMRIKNGFHINGFALNLALKQRLQATRKWPNIAYWFSLSELDSESNISCGATYSEMRIKPAGGFLPLFCFFLLLFFCDSVFAGFVFCKIKTNFASFFFPLAGDYVIIVEDVTSPPFLDVTLAPAFLHVKVTQKKRARSKMESRRN